MANMDPGRAAMISGWKSPDRKGIVAPKYDSKTRITKPHSSSQTRPAGSSSRQQKSNYMTQDELSERFVAEEDKFVLRQSKKKADIRVRERRAKPVDFLAFYFRLADTDRDTFDDDEGDIEIEVPTPTLVLETAREYQLRELEEDIKSFNTLEKNRVNKSYWQALLILCKECRERLVSQGGEERLVGSVASDIDRILSPKTLEQLRALETQIGRKLQSDEPIDRDYWEQLLKRLHVWKAKATLKGFDEIVKEKRISLLKERDPAKAAALEKGLDPTSPTAAQDYAAIPKAKVEAEPDMDGDEAGSIAPPPGTARFSSLGNEDLSQTTKALYDREVARGVGENEEVFATEEAVPVSSKPKWADKYRPRKPRYFNRVAMGYEWNKYNQTHYDHDNPPPKVVQGYKFNIFYPELIDKTKAPTFRIIREDGRRRGESFAPAGEEDTCLIRFSAGPPYEDIAFRIVDREWDYSAKRERGFKSSFEKGILQLHFQFKKIFYRK